MWNKEDLEGFMIESQNNVGQVKQGQELADLIYKLSSDNTNKILVDIGTWNGLGSTRMFIEGMINNKGSILYTIENNTEKINFAKNYWSLFLKQNNFHQMQRHQF
jgi:predicted O-methyltransferase YrrM